MHEYGLRLADKTGANTVVVELIAFIHDIDICRRNDAANLGYGQRRQNLRQSFLMFAPCS